MFEPCAVQFKYFFLSRDKFKIKINVLISELKRAVSDRIIRPLWNNREGDKPITSFLKEERKFRYLGRAELFK